MGMLTGVESWRDQSERATIVRGFLTDKDLLANGRMPEESLAWQIRHEISLAIAARVMVRLGPLLDAAIDSVLKEIGEGDGSKNATA